MKLFRRRRRNDIVIKPVPFEPADTLPSKDQSAIEALDHHPEESRFLFGHEEIADRERSGAWLTLRIPLDPVEAVAFCNSTRDTIKESATSYEGAQPLIDIIKKGMEIENAH